MPTERDQRREETRRRVYEAALELFRRAGVAACRIDDVARAAGVSHGTFYFHYPTKEDVLLERMRETEVEIVAALDLLPSRSRLTAVLATVGQALATAWRADPQLIPEVAAAALRVTASAPLDQRSHLRAALAARFAEAAERGELMTLLPPQILSDIYLSNALGGLLAWVGQREVPLEAILDAVTHLFLMGAGKKKR